MTTASEAQGSGPLLEVKDFSVEYTRRGTHRVVAVDGVSFTVSHGETVGLLGESGSGKSTVARGILGLTPVSGGSVHFAGRDITHWTRQQRRPLATELQVVFQDPYSSMNPVRTIGQTLIESLGPARNNLDKSEIRTRVERILDEVGLPPDASARHPADFSGGQRQRVAIARALIGRPQLVICDEPVSALDLSVQAQVLKLLDQLQRTHRLSYLFISHDLSVVRLIANRVLVLYRGTIVEHGDANDIYQHATHPYTRALLAAAPVPDPDIQRNRAHVRATSSVAVPSRPNVASGCPFVHRCEYAIDICFSSRPVLETTSYGLNVACHRWKEIERESPATGPGHTAPPLAAEPHSSSVGGRDSFIVDP